MRQIGTREKNTTGREKRDRAAVAAAEAGGDGDEMAAGSGIIVRSRKCLIKTKMSAFVKRQDFKFHLWSRSSLSSTVSP